MNTMPQNPRTASIAQVEGSGTRQLSNADVDTVELTDPTGIADGVLDFRRQRAGQIIQNALVKTDCLSIENAGIADLNTVDEGLFLAQSSQRSRLVTENSKSTFISPARPVMPSVLDIDHQHLRTLPAFAMFFLMSMVLVSRMELPPRTEWLSAVTELT